MKKKTFTILLIVLFVGTISNIEAKVWRVNNRPGFNANFSSLSTAISNSSVLAGDTLYVEGSPSSYGDITLSKKLVIIGAGYFLTDNDSTQAFKYPSQVGRIIFNAGSEGSFIAGIHASSYTYSSTSSNPSSSSSVVEINTNNITISNCYIQNYGYTGTYSSYYDLAIFIKSGINNITIQKSFIKPTKNSYSIAYGIYLYGNNNNITISNNIIKSGTKSSSDYSIYMPTSSINTYITNNVIIGRFWAYSAYVVNNIQIAGSISSDQINYYSIIYNNIGQSTQFGTTNGNQSNVNMTNVFTYAPGNEEVDNHYQLIAGSPALLAGFSGEDCGAFGGNNPYKLSGLPSIPAIFDAVMPSPPSVWYPTNTSINVNIKAKGHE